MPEPKHTDSLSVRVCMRQTNAAPGQAVIWRKLWALLLQGGMQEGLDSETAFANGGGNLQAKESRASFTEGETTDVGRSTSGDDA